MKKMKPGDRVWVKNPRVIVERKLGTIVATKETAEGVRYVVEWEVDLSEHRNGHHPGYFGRELGPVHSA